MALDAPWTARSSSAPWRPAMAPPTEGSQQRVPRPLLLPFMADGSRLRPTANGGDSSAPSRTAATPPCPRGTALSFFVPPFTRLQHHRLGQPLAVFTPTPARTPQHRDPPQPRGLSNSMSLLPPGFRHQCNVVRIYGKKEAGTGDHSNKTLISK
ncbi:hypothetical protein DPX16_1669 [Anabarilius grahami]|uniref:Uncharacterized protein n=1 Tax=Anabarilius grahami TaxID=495550 RepID=A0A3N0Y3J1_ANAGA|nr:hypothetical protein DPX16_1669 [Anabarilius grahami]